MESPAFFSTLFVWKMPEKPPKAVAAAIRTAAGKPGTLAAMAWMPVVISTAPKSAGRMRGSSKGRFARYMARMENSMM